MPRPVPLSQKVHEDDDRTATHEEQPDPRVWFGEVGRHASRKRERRETNEGEEHLEHANTLQRVSHRLHVRPCHFDVSPGRGGLGVAQELLDGEEVFGRLVAIGG